MSISPHIVVIGSINVDFVIFTPRCPEKGETLTARIAFISGGGKGANQAVACGHASFTSKYQQDVQVSMIGAEMVNEQTGSDTIIVEESNAADNWILVIPGANHSGMNGIQKIVATLENQCPPCSVVVLQGEIPRHNTTLVLLRHLNRDDGNAPRYRNGIYTIFNPAPMFPEGIPLASISNTTVLVTNETEATYLLTRTSDLSNCDMESRDIWIKSLTQQLHEISRVRIILITLGGNGVFFSTSTGKQGWVDAVKITNVVDTTAAGDTFVGCFASEFAKFVATGASVTDFEHVIENVVRNANVAASVCVQRRGAIQSIPFAYEYLG
ncbi:Ribokinase-like protein [Xylogone sp. PMI_703]|nr:Ribokinase-like protein [Xylogone sp. PMI_703]